MTIKATVKKIGINGEGIAYLDKKITFIQGALPDEEVQVNIVRDEPKYKVGQLVEVTKPSPCRVEAKCKQQKNCLGCPMMIMEYKAQLESKEQLVKDTFTKYVDTYFDKKVMQPIIPASQQTGIRNIVRLPIVNHKDKVAFGIYQRDTKYLTLMKDCPMQSKRINALLNRLEEIFNELHLHIYDEMKKKGLRFLTVREFDAGLQLIFVTGLDRLPDRAVEQISKIEDVHSIYVTINTARKQDFDMQKYECKYTKSKGPIQQIFMQRKFSVSPKADFPVYRQHALRIAKQIQAMIDENCKRIIDLGCGIGLYSLGLDKKYEIKGIDISKINISDAMNSLALEPREMASFEDGKAEVLFTTLSKRQKYDLVMMHIDNMTVQPALIDSIKLSKTDYILIESDHPSQAAKIVSSLTPMYILDNLVCVDGNPNGPGVSVICRLKHRNLA